MNAFILYFFYLNKPTDIDLKLSTLDSAICCISVLHNFIYIRFLYGSSVWHFIKVNLHETICSQTTAPAWTSTEWIMLKAYKSLLSTGFWPHDLCWMMWLEDEKEIMGTSILLKALFIQIPLHEVKESCDVGKFTTN